MIRPGIHQRTLPLFPLAVLAACAQPDWVAEDTSVPPLPEKVYQQAARKGEAVYRVDPQRSRIFIRTGRDGPMKGAGHDHVIASADVDGLVLISDDRSESRADLRLPLQQLVVDDPAYREKFGLEPELPESAIEGTTRNMQDKVLESNRFPWATASVRLLSMQETQAELDVTVTVHGTSLDYTVPADIDFDAGTLSVSGSMTVRHSDFGLTPFSAAGGLLRVAEDIEIVFEITARRGT
jgi:polyisoprenoid-binding protein YceI